MLKNRSFPVKLGLGVDLRKVFLTYLIFQIVTQARMLTHPEESLTVTKISLEERKKQERMRDVVLLLEQLVEREEITLKLIIDCLYDVGLINLVNQKVRNRSLNRFLKAIAKMPKPLARLFALRWLKKNLPTLLANWLEGKVSFTATPVKQKSQKTKIKKDELLSLTEAEPDRQVVVLEQEKKPV